MMLRMNCRIDAFLHFPSALQVLAAVLNFLRQDWGSYMRGGWVLRKAWKIYYKAYAQIRKLYMQRVGLGVNGIGE